MASSLRAWNSALMCTAIAVCLWTSQARLNACSCVGPIPACQATWQAHAVFVGQVLSVADVERALIAEEPSRLFMQRRVSVKVSEVFRGEVSEMATVFTGTGGGDCGYAFRPGSSYLIYAHRPPTGEWTTGICSRTKPVAEAADDLSYLRGPARQPGSLGTIQGVAKYPDPRRDYVPFETAPPYAGGRVTVEAIDPGRQDQYTTMTGPDGKYAVRVPVGKYRVTLTPRDGLYSVGGAMAPDIVDPRGCSEVTFVVRPDGRISGRLLDHEGRPIPAFSVEVMGAAATSRSNFNSSVRARTDATGAFEFTRLTPGEYVVGATLNREPKSESTAIWLSPLAANEPTRITIEPEQRVWAGDLQLPSSVQLSSISGAVTRADGKPAIGARVYVLTTPSFGIAAGPVEVDAAGSFTFTVIAGRRYRLSAELVGEPGPDRLRKAESEPFTPGAGATSVFSLRIH